MDAIKPRKVKISEMGFMGCEDYYATALFEDENYIIADLGEPCPIHGKIIKVNKRTVTWLKH